MKRTTSYFGTGLAKNISEKHEMHFELTKELLKMFQYELDLFVCCPMLTHLMILFVCLSNSLK